MRGVECRCASGSCARVGRFWMECALDSSPGPAASPDAIASQAKAEIRAASSGAAAGSRKESEGLRIEN